MGTKPNIERTNPCKICGKKENLIFSIKKNKDGTFTFIIKCGNCGTTLLETGPTRDRVKTSLIKKWNTFTKEEIISYSSKVILPKEEMKTKKVKEKLSKININELKRDALHLSTELIEDFKKNNPKENCPVSLGDLLKLFGWSDEEILNKLNDSTNKIFASKKYLSSYSEMIDKLNSGKILYRLDECGITWKYSPMRKFKECEREELTNILKASGFTTKNSFILNSK